MALVGESDLRDRAMLAESGLVRSGDHWELVSFIPFADESFLERWGLYGNCVIVARIHCGSIF